MQCSRAWYKISTFIFISSLLPWNRCSCLHRRHLATFWHLEKWTFAIRFARNRVKLERDGEMRMNPSFRFCSPFSHKEGFVKNRTASFLKRHRQQPTDGIKWRVKKNGEEGKLNTLKEAFNGLNVVVVVHVVNVWKPDRKLQSNKAINGYTRNMYVGPFCHLHRHRRLQQWILKLCRTMKGAFLQ